VLDSIQVSVIGITVDSNNLEATQQSWSPQHGVSEEASKPLSSRRFGPAAAV